MEGLRPSQVMFEDGTSLLYDDWHRDRNKTPKNLRFKFSIINSGADIANNIRRIMHVSDQQFSKDLFEQLTDISTPILQPGKHLDITFDITWERFTELGERNLFAGISISYDGPKGKKYTGEIYGLQSGSNYVLDSW